jgi:protoporphyrinogen oxidase
VDPDRLTRVAVVGGGILGSTLALRIASAGVGVDLYEAEDQLGGLSIPAELGGFSWDRFYHCILPSDAALLGLIGELGLGGELVWRRTRAGVRIDGAIHPLDGALDLLRLPRLSLWSKLRIGALAALAPRRPATAELDRITAAAWLRRWCGRSGFEGFWRHLLRCKLGEAADRVAARFIHATIQRLASARSGAGGDERLGYVRGGYRRILGQLREALLERGVGIRTGRPVTAVRSTGAGARVVTAAGGDEYGAVVLTVPNPVLARIVDGLSEADAERLAATPYLGVACTVAVGAEPLSPNYVLNLCDEGLSITGVVEMTSLISAAEETGGRTLVYLPRYALADGGLFGRSDEEIAAEALADLARVHPRAQGPWLQHVEVHRARFIQPVPLAGGPLLAPPRRPVPGAPVFVVNSAQIASCVLNTNDCIRLAAAAAAEILSEVASRPVMGCTG